MMEHREINVIFNKMPSKLKIDTIKISGTEWSGWGNNFLHIQKHLIDFFLMPCWDLMSLWKSCSIESNKITTKVKLKGKKKGEKYISSTMLLPLHRMGVLYSIFGMRTQLCLRKMSHGDVSLMELPILEPSLPFNGIRKSLLLTTTLRYITWS